MLGVAVVVCKYWSPVEGSCLVVSSSGPQLGDPRKSSKMGPRMGMPISGSPEIVPRRWSPVLGIPRRGLE